MGTQVVEAEAEAEKEASSQKARSFQRCQAKLIQTSSQDASRPASRAYQIHFRTAGRG